MRIDDMIRRALPFLAVVLSGVCALPSTMTGGTAMFSSGVNFHYRVRRKGFILIVE